MINCNIVKLTILLITISVILNQNIPKNNFRRMTNWNNMNQQ